MTDGDIWICKPAGLNRGQGIFLAKDTESVIKSYTKHQKRATEGKPHKPRFDRIVQRYIQNPLLVDGRKFDLRVFQLVICGDPSLVLYRPGYARLCLETYDQDSPSLSAHLTNQAQQKKIKEYQNRKDDTIWSMEYLNKYFNTHYQHEHFVEKDWVQNKLSVSNGWGLTYLVNWFIKILQRITFRVFVKL